MWDQLHHCDGLFQNRQWHWHVDDLFDDSLWDMLLARELRRNSSEAQVAPAVTVEDIVLLVLCPEIC